MRTLEYMQDGERRKVEVSKRNEMRLSAAMLKAADHGHSDHCVTQSNLEGDPLVVILSHYWPNGTEAADYRRTRGKYPGNSCGFSIRPEDAAKIGGVTA